jgi:hypothetical protein
MALNRTFDRDAELLKSKTAKPESPKERLQLPVFKSPPPAPPQVQHLLSQVFFLFPCSFGASRRSGARTLYHYNH